MLDASGNPDFSDCFMASIENIFQYAQVDIKNSLGKLDQIRLSELRKTLSDKCIELLPTLKEKDL